MAVAGHGTGELSRIGEVLRAYRKGEGLTQRQLAEMLSVDPSYVSRIEGGERDVRDVEFLRQIADLLGIPATHLGLSSEPTVSSDASDPAAVSQAQWRTVRRYLNQHRHDLATEATRLYHADWRVGRTPLIAPVSWLPAEPVPLERIHMEWDTAYEQPRVTGREPETSPVRPLRSPGHQFEDYTTAVRYIDRPALFENRTSYRLLGLRWDGDSGRMSFGLANYFDKLNVAEALGHELAEMSLSRGDEIGMVDLPFRSLVGNPFDTARRAALPAVTTLTLRRRRTHGDATFLLHWRDPAKVATAAGIYDVIPAGEFQPSSMSPFDQDNDFDLWRSIVRECSEELLGEPERDGSQSEPIDYAGWPFYRTLQLAREDGRLRVYCLGAGVDALTLAPTILTVAVFDDDVFDAVFRDAVEVNTEGVVVTSEDNAKERIGLPFDAKTVERVLEHKPMASPGAACLKLAWRHRVRLLAP